LASLGHIGNIPDMPRAEPIFPVKKLVNLTDDQAKRIADFRFSHRIASENEAIRQLVEAGLEAAGFPAPQPKG
jgi:hypothetical protein